MKNPHAPAVKRESEEELGSRADGDPVNRPSTAPAPTARLAGVFSLPPRRRGAKRQPLFASVRAFRGQSQWRRVPCCAAPALCTSLHCPCRENSNSSTPFPDIESWSSTAHERLGAKGGGPLWLSSHSASSASAAQSRPSSRYEILKKGSLACIASALARSALRR